MPKGATFTVEEMLASISTSKNSRLLKIGIVRPVKDNQRALLFAPGLNNFNWTEIDEGHIVSYKLLFWVNLNGDPYPLVQLRLSSSQRSALPSSDGVSHVPSQTTSVLESEAVAFTLKAVPPPGVSRLLLLPVTPGSGSCHYDWGKEKWVCP